MIVSDSHKFIFFHIAKTAGSSLTYALAPYSRDYDNDRDNQKPGWQGRYHTLNTDRGIVGATHHSVQSANLTGLEDYFKFAVVRNPFTRYSSYFHKAHIPEGRSLEEVLEKFGDYNNISVCKTQKQYLYPKEQMDMILRYETLAEDYEKLKRIIGIDEDLPKLNTSTNSVGENIYDDKTAKLLLGWYEEDFDYFGYSKDYKRSFGGSQ